MTLTFCKRVCVDDCAHLIADSDVTERVILSADLSWAKHVKYIVAKASKRMFAICQLVRCGFAHVDIVSVYCALIRPLVEYACPVWHCGLTTGQADGIENIKNNACVLYIQT